MLKRFPLEYSQNCTELFARVRHLGQAVLLDSGFPSCQRGRFDIISAGPIAQLCYKNGQLSGTNLPFDPSVIDDPFTALSLLQTYAKQQTSSVRFLDNTLPNTPFCGGLLGHFSYDLGRCIEDLPSIAVNDIELPEMHMGLYAWAIIIDHQTMLSYVVGCDLIDSAAFSSLCDRLCANDSPPRESPNFKLKKRFKSNLDADYYAASLDKIDQYILSGDCYQVNFAQRFSAQCGGDPWQAYLKLRGAAPTHFSAFIETDQGAILSLSPERFLKVNCAGQVMTQPIKGTQPRAFDPQQDAINKEYLINSEKDRSENLMIVDLMRNDISKSCELHSVEVPALFAIESYQNVHHLVSTVTGQLDPKNDPISLLRNCFPGGSITGAPKIRAMEIIDELEPHRRSIYCGSIGYLSLCGQMDTSITIRTLLVEKDTIYCWAGGGIVADSQIDAEYQETFDKVNNLLNALESI